MGSLTGKIALVTGASLGGTGRSIAIRLAAEGAKVAITARTQEGLRKTQSAIEAFGGTVLLLPCDLGDPKGGRTTLIERAEKALGPLDILVNNAVSHGQKPFNEWSLAEIEQLQQVNVWAPWQLMTDAVSGMRQRGRGWILNMTSFAGELPPGPPFTSTRKEGGAIYGMTKAALNRVTVAAAGELEGSGIAANALAPQIAIRTPEVEAWGQVPGDLLEPLETMVEAALALCTGDRAVLTGRIAYSLQLLVELQRPVKDLRGQKWIEGWQPRDLIAPIRFREAFNAEQLGWPHCYDFNRPNTPYPKVLRDG
jgi:NAD(P)-dependent dehydrogenase (short-subunit alcohol dehydrogenase family)